MASKTRKTFGTIAKFGLPILGGIFGGPAGAAAGGAAGGALSGEKGALKNAAIGGAMGYGGAKLLGAGGSSGGNSLGSSLTNSFSNSSGGSGNFLSNLINPLMSMFSGGGGGNAYAATAGAPTGFSGMTSSGPGVNVGFGRNPLQQPQQSTASKTSGFNLGSLGNSNLLGPLIMGASQLIRSPQVPELPQSILDFQSAARQGNPLQNQAAQALSQQLGQTQQNMSQDEMDALNRQYDLAQEQELKSVDSMYKSLRPGSDPLTDTSYQKDLGRVRDRYATLRADSAAQMQRQISNDFASQRAQQIAQASGLGEQQLQQLAQLGQYDLDRVMDQMAMSYNDKSMLRNYILQLGGNIAASGFQKNPLYASPFASGGNN